MDYFPEDYEYWTDEEKCEYLTSKLVESGHDVNDVNAMDLDELEEEFNNYMSELDAAEDLLYPNGRDYDAEDFDD